MKPSPPDLEWFSVVDTAQDPSLYALATSASAWEPLVAGAPPGDLAATLPYVVRLRQNEAIAERWRTVGAGRNWGIHLQSSLPINQLRLHFKKFLTVDLPDGRRALFRFYDPRVFRTYIRAASPEERDPWFRGVACYVVENGRGGSHTFRLHDGRLYDGAVPAR